MHLIWNDQSTKEFVDSTKPRLTIRGDADPTAASLLRTSENPHANQLGLLAPKAYLQGVANFYDTVSWEEFVAFYRQAVAQGILHRQFRFALMHVNPGQRFAELMLVDRYRVYLDTQILTARSSDPTRGFPEDALVYQETLILGLDRDTFPWPTPLSHHPAL